MAKHEYRLVYLPQHFPDTYVLVTYEGASYAVRVYSEDHPVRKYGPERFDGASLRELLASAEDNRHADEHRTQDETHWFALIRRLNRRIGQDSGLDLR